MLGPRHEPPSKRDVRGESFPFIYVTFGLVCAGNYFLFADCHMPLSDILYAVIFLSKFVLDLFLSYAGFLNITCHQSFSRRIQRISGVKITPIVCAMLVLICAAIQFPCTGSLPENPLVKWLKSDRISLQPIEHLLYNY